MTLRRLNARWVAAGRRRIVARGLRAEGKTFGEIGAMLGVSDETARRDCDVMPIPVQIVPRTVSIVCAEAPPDVPSVPAMRSYVVNPYRIVWTCSWCGARVKVVA